MTMTVIVAGLPRCGTSLTMQMLQAGGIPCFGEYPAFEPDETYPDPARRDINTLIRKGVAFKWIDPQRDLIRPANALGVKVIWLDRDSHQQARSQVKLIETLNGFTVPKREQTIRNIAKSIRRDREICLDLFADAGMEVFTAAFETILAMPHAFARDLHGFLRADFNEHGAAKCVIARTPECRADMGLEMSLIESRGL